MAMVPSLTLSNIQQWPSLLSSIKQHEINRGYSGFKGLKEIQTDFIPAPAIDDHGPANKLIKWILVKRFAVLKDMAGRIDVGTRVRGHCYMMFAVALMIDGAGYFEGGWNAIGVDQHPLVQKLG